MIKVISKTDKTQGGTQSGVEATEMNARSGPKQCMPIPGGGESDGKRGAGWARGCRGITDHIW